MMEVKKILTAIQAHDRALRRLCEATQRRDMTEARRQRWFACLNLLRATRYCPSSSLKVTAKQSVAELLRPER